MDRLLAFDAQEAIVDALNDLEYEIVPEGIHRGRLHVCFDPRGHGKACVNAVAAFAGADLEVS